VHNQWKVQTIAHKQRWRSALGKMSMDQLRPDPREGVVEEWSYGEPAIKLAAAARRE
jgi:hypothetical protein